MPRRTAPDRRVELEPAGAAREKECVACAPSARKERDALTTIGRFPMYACGPSSGRTTDPELYTSPEGTRGDDPPAS